MIRLPISQKECEYCKYKLVLDPSGTDAAGLSGEQQLSTPNPTEMTSPVDLQTSGHRALIYDAKQDIVAQLHGISPDCPIVILNPFDDRCAAWDMGKDITEPVTAQQVAKILIPEDKNASQPFFPNAARNLLTRAMLALMQLKPEEWDFRDLVLAMSSKESLSQLLSQLPQTRDAVSQYLSAPVTADNIMTEIASRMGAYEFVAAAWGRATHKVSLTHWLENEYILVLGNNEQHRAALDPINRVIFKRLTELILSQSESETRRTWIFLDEVREAGDLDGLGRLMTKGRSKGACVVLGFQDIEGMRDAYGEKVANEIVSMCANKAFLRLDSEATALWASKLLGDYEVIEEEESRQEGTSRASGSSYSDGVSHTPGLFFKGLPTGKQSGGGTSTTDTESESRTKNRKRAQKAAVLPSQFGEIPVTNRRNGLTGYFIVPIVGAYRATIAPERLAALTPPDPSRPNLVPRPAAHQWLEPWTQEERARLTSAPVAAPSGVRPSGGKPSGAPPGAIPVEPPGKTPVRDATPEEHAAFAAHMPRKIRSR